MWDNFIDLLGIAMAVMVLALFAGLILMVMMEGIGNEDKE